MNTQRTIRNACRELLGLRRAQGGNVMVTFALALIPVMGAVGAGVDYSRASSAKAAMQAALDSAALGTIQVAFDQKSKEIKSTALDLFNASFNRPDASNINVTTTYDDKTNTLTVNGSASIKSDFMGVIGIPEMTVAGSSTVTMASKVWQVCVLITEPLEKHTLKVDGGAKIDFDNCMVQVNTANWDAVESRDGGYIHSKNGENCFVGDIHYGDVQPPKNPSCTMLQDPYATYQAPNVDCNGPGVITNKVANLAGEVLSPGTYCGGIVVNKSVTFNKGLYIIKDGKFQITGSGTNVTANGVTFLLTGSGSYLDFNTPGNITMSPANEADAGKFAGFQFFYDEPDFEPNGKKKGNKKGAKSNISSAKMDASGIFYLAGQQFTFDNKANVTIKPGVIIADYILPEGGAHLNLTGTMPTSSVALESMTKTGSSGPRLIK